MKKLFLSFTLLCLFDSTFASQPREQRWQLPPNVAVQRKMSRRTGIVSYEAEMEGITLYALPHIQGVPFFHLSYGASGMEPQEFTAKKDAVCTIISGKKYDDFNGQEVKEVAKKVYWACHDRYEEQEIQTKVHCATCKGSDVEIHC